MRCPVCKADYERTMKDGGLYFHECSPLSLSEFRAKFPAFTGETTPHPTMTLADYKLLHPGYVGVAVPSLERPGKLREGATLPKPVNHTQK